MSTICKAYGHEGSGIFCHSIAILVFCITLATPSIAQQDYTARMREWKESNPPIMATINRLLAEKKWQAANDLASKYLIAAPQEMRPIIRDTNIKILQGSLDATSPKNPERRLVILGKLVTAEPTNPKWKQQLELATKAQAAAIKAEKRRQGVRIGMTKQDALDSSWGRPQHINRTTTIKGEEEQWVYGGHNYIYFTNGVLTAFQN